MGKKVVIIGGVAGGATAAARLRRLDEEVEIILLERGDYISYANCGLPYHIGDVIQDRQALLLQTPQGMKEKYNIDVRVNNEALSIDKEGRKVSIKNLATGEVYDESYDRLIIATGSSPIKPSIPGIDGAGIFTLWTVPDTDKIKNYISEKKPKRAAVIGGGFIGLEMAENLHAAGCATTIIEMQDQVMAPIDFEMAQLLHENLKSNKVDLMLRDGVQSFESHEDTTRIHLQSGKTIETDLVILSIGIKANSELARNAGLALNQRGGVLVDAYLKTSDNNIYAVGDVIEVEDLVTKNKTMVPLAGPANKQARICADNIAKEFGLISGNPVPYKGTQGTSIAKVFDLTVGATGVNEKTLKKLGKEIHKDYHAAIITQRSHAGYYPGACLLTIKLLFDPAGAILGAQIIGQEGVDKRIDTIATALRLGGSIYDLTELELAYAPPYSSAKDPVNMAGFVAENILQGIVSIADWDEVAKLEAGKSDGHLLLDITEDVERMVYQLPNSLHIPMGQLRTRLHELDKEKLIITYCAIGVRAYNAARVLMNAGFKNVKVYPGGISFYKALYSQPSDADNGDDLTAGAASQALQGEELTVESKNKEEVIDMNNIVAKEVLDCSGLQCPGPIMRVFQKVNDMKEGEILQVSATDMGFPRDVEAWCKRTGNSFLKAEKQGKENIIYIQKGLGNSAGVVGSSNLAQGQGGPVAVLPQGKTIIVFSGDLDKVLASFIIANGAASMGRPVTMFFTFWGLNVLRKAEKQGIKKPFMDKMFGAMMPRGSTRLTLSNMNMGGMGTKMMKKVMQDKNVDSLEALMKQAMFNGVKLVACTMSMDIMGITKEELMDGVEYAGVATYLGDAEESNVNLFI